MKRLTIPLVAAFVGSAFFGPVSTEGQAAKALLIVPEDSSADLEYMLTMEVGVMQNLLEEAGIDVDVATASGEPLVAEVTTLTPDLKFSDVNVTDYAGIVMPCLATADTARALPPELAAIIREAMTDGKPVAAQTGGIIALADVGVLSGKKYAYVEEWVATIPQFEDAIYSGNGIVQDGNIITSGVCPYAARMLDLPDGTTGLIEALIAQISGEG
jgi:putative intracellular protease/amidase